MEVAKFSFFVYIYSGSLMQNRVEPALTTPVNHFFPKTDAFGGDKIGLNICKNPILSAKIGKNDKRNEPCNSESVCLINRFIDHFFLKKLADFLKP